MRYRIGLGWTTFGKLDSIMQNISIPLELKMKVHNEYILPVITYGRETWYFNKTQLQKMFTTQCKMEQRLYDRKSASWICSKMGITDIIHQIHANKHRWAGHVSWLKDNRWTKCVTEWCPQHLFIILLQNMSQHQICSSNAKNMLHIKITWSEFMGKYANIYSINEVVPINYVTRIAEHRWCRAMTTMMMTKDDDDDENATAWLHILSWPLHQIIQEPDRLIM